MIIPAAIKSTDELLEHRRIALMEVLAKHIYARNILAHEEAIAQAFLIAQNNNISIELVIAALTYLASTFTEEEIQGLFEKITERIPYYKENDIMRRISFADKYEEKGRQEGIQIGQQKAQREMILGLLDSGVDDRIIMKVVPHISKAELEDMKNRS